MPARAALLASIPVHACTMAGSRSACQELAALVFLRRLTAAPGAEGSAAQSIGNGCLPPKLTRLCKTEDLRISRKV